MSFFWGDGTLLTASSLIGWFRVCRRAGTTRAVNNEFLLGRHTLSQLISSVATGWDKKRRRQ